MRVAYLHGFAGDLAAWDAALAELRARGFDHDAHRVALPGHGAAGGPVLATWDANLAAIAASIEASIAASLGPAPVDLVVGYSLGARAALGLVATGRAPRTILVSVNPGIDDADRPARRAGDAAWARLLRERGTAAFAEAWEAQPLFATQSRAPAAALAERRARRLSLDPEGLARSLEVMGLGEMPDYRAAVAELAARPGRLSLIAGAGDAKFLAIARALPAPLAVIPDCGHDPTLEQPALLAGAIAEAAAAIGSA